MINLRFHFISLIILFALTTVSGVCHAFGEKGIGQFGQEKNQEKNQSAAEIDLKEPMTVKARFQPSAVEAGGTVELIIDLQLAEHYHAYFDRLKLTIEKPDDLLLAPFKVAPLVDFYDPASKSQKSGVENRSTLRAIVEVPSGFKAGRQTVEMKFVYQACTAEHCLFPKTIHVEAPLAIEADISGVKQAEPIAGETQSGAANEFEKALRQSLLSAFLLVFGVGFLTCLTPCIYPMIPITLAVLGARAHGQSHWKNFSLALVYVLGIALTYAMLGLFAASTGGFFGAALSNVWVVTAIALVFFAMGLSMFGLFEVQAPAFVRNRLGAARTTSGYGGAFMTGLLAGVVASPCVGPVLVSILAFIAQTQDRLLGFFMLFVFALGMGVPFIALGLSSSALTRLPKAGPWMEIVKSFFGIVMVGMAFYYVRPLYPNWLFHFLLGSAAIALASILGVFSRLREKQLAPVGHVARAVLVLALVGGAVTAIIGVGERFGLAGANGPDVPGKAAKLLAWKAYSEAEFAVARQSGLPVLMDFTAEWCGACQEMEQSTFVDSRVVEASKKFALLQVDGTEDSAVLHEVLAKFKVQGFPTYIFFDKYGERHDDLTGLGYLNAEEFLKRMDAVR